MKNLVQQAPNSKGTVYQGGITVPFIISGPDVINPNRTSDALVNTVDLYATILELFGAINWQSQIGTTIVDSKSLLPILNNTATTVRPWAFAEVFRVTPLASDGKAIRNETYKLIKFVNWTQKFFNLLLDPTETTDILTTAMTAIDSANYNYLCSEMATLFGTGITCTNLATDSFWSAINEIVVVENPIQCTIAIKNVSSETVFELYNSNGAKLFEGKDIASKDFSFLSKGIYFVKVVDQNQVFQLIKK